MLIRGVRLEGHGGNGPLPWRSASGSAVCDVRGLAIAVSALVFLVACYQDDEDFSDLTPEEQGQQVSFSG